MSTPRPRDRRPRLAAGISVVLCLALLAPASALAADAPPNDLFAKATLVTSFPFTDTAVDLSQATYRDLAAGEVDERTPSTSTPPSTVCSTGGWVPMRSVWYRIVPEASATLTVTVTPEDPSVFTDWRIADFFVASTDTLGGLSAGVCNAPGATGRWPVTFGRTYYIQITDSGSGGGTFDLGMNLTAPSYDASSTFRMFTSAWSTDVLDVSMLSSDPGEAHDCGAGDRTAWYAYTATSSPPAASLRVKSIYSTVDDALLVVYRWTSSGLSLVSCGSNFTFSIASGTSYRVQVSSARTTGHLRVDWSIPPVIDTAPPVIQWHESFSVPADSPAGATVDYELPIATDNVDGTVPVTCDPAPGMVVPVGVTWVHCSARDQAGNVAWPTSFYVRVIGPIAVAPIVPIVGYDVFDAPGSGFRFWYHTYSGTITDTGRRIGFGPYEPVPVVNETGGSGTLTDGWSAGTDTSMLLTTEYASGGHLSPAIVLHLGGTYRLSTITVYGGEPFDSYNRFWAGLLSSAIVEIGGQSQRIYSAPLNGSGYTYDVIDLSGTALATIPTDRIVLRDFEAINFNAVHDTFGVSEITVDGTFVPNLPPVVEVPADTTVEATRPSGASVAFTATAVDPDGESLMATCDPASGSTFPLGSTTVTCIATDSLGATDTGTFKVDVVDTTAPTIDITGWADSFAVDATIGFDASATDAVDDAPSLACTLRDSSGAIIGTSCRLDNAAWALGLGTFTYRVMAKDAANNLSSVSKDFKVRATYPSVSSLTLQWVTKAGVAKDLAALLDSASAAEKRGQLLAEAGKLAEYLSLVTAQSGKSITPARAQMLVGFSYGL